MNEVCGKVFNIISDNRCVEGCTISKLVINKENKLWYFSLGCDTDISAEIFPYHKFIYLLKGKLKIVEDLNESMLYKYDSYLGKINSKLGFVALEDSIYVELEIKGEDYMNKKINAGEVFKLENLLPYEEGRIVNMDIMHNEQMKFVIMSFDANQALSEHAAPGEAMIFALDGEAIIGYEGKEYTLKKGENFCFAKGGLHSVKAVTKFKMALILSL